MGDLRMYVTSTGATPAMPSREDVQLRELGPASIMAIRARADAATRVVHALGLPSLPAPNRVVASSPLECLWIRPDEWWVVAPLAQRREIHGQARAALASHEGAVVDLSASRTVFELAGASARDVLASACPLDLHPRVFAVDQCAQSVIAKAPVLLQLMDDAPRWHLYVRPSLVAYVTGWLHDAMEGA